MRLALQRNTFFSPTLSLEFSANVSYSHLPGMSGIFQKPKKRDCVSYMRSQGDERRKEREIVASSET